MRSFIIVSMVAFGLVVGGCGGGDEADDKGSSKEAASADEYCDSVCAKRASCSASVDRDVCVNECRRANGVDFERFRSDFVKGIQACVDRKDCAAIINDDVVADCQSEERAKLTTTSAAESFCQRADAQYKKCGGGSLDAGTCYTAVKTFNDGALAEAESCLEKDCTVYKACVKSSIGVSFPEG